MYNLDQLKQFLFIDIETVSEVKSLNELKKTNEKKVELWSSRAEFLRERYPENIDLSDEDLYQMKAGLHAEYGKIICISLGNIISDKKISIKSYYGDDEKKLLQEFQSLVELFFNKYPRASIVGHNVERFDVPVICKRSIINKVPISDPLLVHDKKPWEMAIKDTAKLWSHGAWQESFTSLDLLCNVLDVPSPKDGVKASEVQDTYYNKNGLDSIVEYCEKDIVATANCLLRMSGLDLVER
jgi:predicted PolB exonuclease-like 3'-5' exonuclease